MSDEKVEALNQQLYFTQKELAARWKVSQSSIINWRKSGTLPFFSIPGSNRVLYPTSEIVELERKFLNMPKEVQSPKSHHAKVEREKKNNTESKRKKPVVSAGPNKEWRI